MYQNISKISRSFKKWYNFLAEEDGTLITSQQDIEKKWTEYLKNLLNCEEPTDVSMDTDSIQRDKLPSTKKTRNRVAD